MYLLCTLYVYCIHCILMYLVLRVVASFMATFQFNFFFPLKINLDFFESNFIVINNLSS